MAKALEINEQNFEQVVGNARTPVLIDFWAGWCPPCRAMGPTVDALAEDLAGVAVVGKVDTEANPRLAARFQVRSIPSFVVVENGVEVARHTGMASKQELRNLTAAKATA